MVFRKDCLIVICIITSIWPLYSYPAEKADIESQAQNDSDFPWWQDTHRSVSTTIGEWAGNIDEYFSGHSNAFSSDSYANIRFGPILKEDSYSGFFDLKAKLKLPNTQDRLRLVIEANGDSLVPENEQGESSEQSNIVNSALDSNFSAAIRYIKNDIGADLDAGILVDFPLDPFLRLRFQQGDKKTHWEWWQKQEMFAYYSEGIGARYSVGFGYNQSALLDYRTDFGITWLDKDGLFYARENFFIRHNINEKNTMLYQLSFLQSGENDLQKDSFLYNVLYEHLLYKSWLIGQVKPQFTHDIENDYDGEFSLTLSLSILLGPQYLH